MPQPKACWAEGGISGGSFAGAPPSCAPHLSPGFSEHPLQTHPDVLCSGGAPGQAGVCRKAGASSAWGTPWCGPSAPQPFSMLLRFFSYFSSSQGEEKA